MHLHLAPRLIFSVVLGALSMTLLPLWAADAAPSAVKAELKTSFEHRAAELAAAKAAGTIGECTDGKIAAVGTADATLTALIEAENTDRMRLYQVLANETNAAVLQISERNAMRNYQNAKAGEWLRTRDGQWKKK